MARRRKTITPAGRRWVRINSEAERLRAGFRLPSGHVIKPPRVQRLPRGFTYFF